MPPYSRATPSPGYVEIARLLRERHERGEHHFSQGLAAHVPRIKELALRTSGRTIFDYSSNRGFEAEIWGGVKAAAYRHDVVFAVDVLEHVPDDDVDWVIDELFADAASYVYATVGGPKALWMNRFYAALQRCGRAVRFEVIVRHDGRSERIANFDAVLA